MTPLFAAEKIKALKTAKEIFFGHRLTVVLNEGKPGTLPDMQQVMATMRQALQ